MAASYAVLFKVHFWDSFAQRQLERLKAQVGRGDIFVFVDETNGAAGPIDHDAERILRFREADTKALGLPQVDQYSQFWWSADYALHLLTAHRPPYDYYVTVEFDVVINRGLDSMVDEIDGDRVDFVGDPILDPPIERFHWLDTARGVYALDEMQAWLTCIAVFSRRAARLLFDNKLELGNRLAAAEIDTIPFCEIAIPTAISIAGLNMRPLNQYGDIEHFKWTPPYDEADLPRLASNTFVHPVLEGKRLVANLMKWYPDHTHFLDADSFLRKRLVGRYSIQIAIPILYEEMRRAGNRDFCTRLLGFARAYGDAEFLEFHGLTVRNLALNRPATQSSWFGWNVRPDEPGEAVIGCVTGAASFHTEADEAPWWMVDLQRRATVDEIRVFNRLEVRNRADGLRVLISNDATAWIEVGRHRGASFGGADGRPLVVPVGQNARFIRVELPRCEYLHLDQIQVVGSAPKSPFENGSGVRDPAQ